MRTIESTTGEPIEVPDLQAIPAAWIELGDEPCDPPTIIDSRPETVVYDEQGRLIWSDDWPTDEMIRAAMRHGCDLPPELGGEG